MSEDRNTKLSREERLAAKLRENLRRRKAQTRQIGESDAGEPSALTVNKNDPSQQ